MYTVNFKPYVTTVSHYKQNRGVRIVIGLISTNLINSNVITKSMFY